MSNQPDIQGDLRINPHDLDNEIIRQPGLYAYYSELLGQEQRRFKQKKLEFSVYEATLGKQIRDRLEALGKKPTDRAVEHVMHSDDNWIRRKRELIDIEADMDKFQNVIWALVQKKEMLITYASNRRQEMSQGFAIRDQNKGIPLKT